jgi:hypothetical protein
MKYRYTENRNEAKPAARNGSFSRRLGENCVCTTVLSVVRVAFSPAANLFNPI